MAAPGGGGGGEKGEGRRTGEEAEKGPWERAGKLRLVGVRR